MLKHYKIPQLVCVLLYMAMIEIKQDKLPLLITHNTTIYLFSIFLTLAYMCVFHYRYQTPYSDGLCLILLFDLRLQVFTKNIYTKVCKMIH